MLDTMPTIHWDGMPSAEIAKEWGSGCTACQFGVIGPAPEPKLGIPSLYIERRAQFNAGVLNLCTCKAGQMYRKFLMKREGERDKQNNANS